jgi:ribosomal-protein-alanine N-acetyltransferase
MSPDSQPSFALHDGVVLTTPRLVLRAVGEADISPLYQKIFSVPEVMSWVFAGKALSRDEAECFIRANFNFEAASTGLCVLADRASGEVMGFAGLNPCQILANDDLEIGFVLAREAWGRGFATEIGQAQLAFGFKRLARTRLLALASAQNAASIRTLEKLGMHYHLEVTPAGRTPRRVYCLGADEWYQRNP